MSDTPRAPEMRIFSDEEWVRYGHYAELAAALRKAREECLDADSLLGCDMPASGREALRRGIDAMHAALANAATPDTLRHQVGNEVQKAVEKAELNATLAARETDDLRLVLKEVLHYLDTGFYPNGAMKRWRAAADPSLHAAGNKVEGGNG